MIETNQQLQKRLDAMGTQTHKAAIATRDDKGQLKDLNGNPIDARPYSTIHVIVAVKPRVMAGKKRVDD